MKTMNWNILAIALALLAALALALVWAPEPARAGMQPKSVGISKEARTAHPDYPVKFVFAMASGAYLADIDVTVKDLDGNEVVKTHSEGPWLYVDIPAGEYMVVAERKSGERTSARFAVNGDAQDVVRLAWGGMS